MKAARLQVAIFTPVLMQGKEVKQLETSQLELKGLVFLLKTGNEVGLVPLTGCRCSLSKFSGSSKHETFVIWSLKGLVEKLSSDLQYILCLFEYYV